MPTIGWMHIKPDMPDKLETEDDYRKALNRFLELSCIRENSLFKEEFFGLIKLLEEYEKENC
jgi:hypothetical protein